jgi:hypothetical protein
MRKLIGTVGAGLLFLSTALSVSAAGARAGTSQSYYCQNNPSASICTQGSTVTTTGGARTSAQAAAQAQAQAQAAAARAQSCAPKTSAACQALGQQAVRAQTRAQVLAQAAGIPGVIPALGGGGTARVVSAVAAGGSPSAGTQAVVIGLAGVANRSHPSQLPSTGGATPPVVPSPALFTLLAISLLFAGYRYWAMGRRPDQTLPGA